MNINKPKVNQRWIYKVDDRKMIVEVSKVLSRFDTAGTVIYTNGLFSLNHKSNFWSIITNPDWSLLKNQDK